MIIIVIGVSGSGKTTLGQHLAETLGWRFEDGDKYHSTEAKEKMRSGIPLTDEDRMAWLGRLQGIIRDVLENGESAILCFSGLKRRYRDMMRIADNVHFVWLDTPKEELQVRVETREHEYMPASLLPSQIASFEIPLEEERVLRLGSGTVASLAETVLAELRVA